MDLSRHYRRLLREALTGKGRPLGTILPRRLRFDLDANMANVGSDELIANPFLHRRAVSSEI